jgi:putative hemolysin
MQACYHPSTKRGVLGLALAISAGPVAALAPTSAEARDARFARWARDFARLDAQIEAAPMEIDADEDRVNAFCDRAGAIERRILHTPSDGRRAAEVKLKTLIRYLDRDNVSVTAPVRHVLAFVEKLA